MPGQVRYRRCPQCQGIRPASEFRRATGPAAASTFAARDAQRRRCPQCGHVGPLADFPIAERPGEPEPEQESN